MSHLGKSIAQLSVQIQAGKLDPRELAEETLSAIDGYADKAVFTLLTTERAKQEAQAAFKRINEGRSLGVLDGIPVAWKDLFDLQGEVTTAGSVVLKKSAPAHSDAAVVSALKNAGMVAIGRTNMSEFAFSGLGINPHYGTPINPYSNDEPRIPGGSSSGSGVAVSAGLVPVAMGTDTGGSIRIPAAFNGVVGYKATRGRYDMAGAFPLAESLDSLGPLCRTVQDAVWVDAAMRGRTCSDIARAEIAGKKFVIAETIMFDGIESEVVEAFEEAVKKLERKGAVIRRAKFALFLEIFELIIKHGALVTAEAFALHKSRLEGTDANEMDPRVVVRTRLGQKTTVADYIAIAHARQRMIAEFAKSVSSDEIILSPTLPHVAPALSSLIENDEAFFAMNGKTLRNTQIGNFLDWCGVSIPCGLGRNGLPIGISLAGLPGQDEKMLAVALAAENILRN